jgi:hypothetical protein
MWEPTLGPDAPPSGYEPRQPAGPVLILIVVASACLFVSAAILPWVRWGVSVQTLSNVGTTVSLWDMVSNDTAAEFGASWLPGVGVAMVVAAAGSLLELFWRPVTRAPRYLALAGFGGAVAISCFGLFAGVGTSGNSPAVLPSTFGASLDLGFWVALITAVAGAVASIILIEDEPNPARKPVPFAPSPWGPPPGILPAGYYPPGVEWSEYAKRGQVPPGYVAPSYKEAVYPTPGFVTPAYTMPGNIATDFETTFDLDGESPEASSGADGSSNGSIARGHLLVVESGRSTLITVEDTKRLLVGRDPDAEIRLADPKVGPRHATIERRGEDWAVQDVDALKPTRLIDAWGTNRQVRGETTISSGLLVVGDVVITLYANRPGPAPTNVEPRRPDPTPSADS